MTNPAVTDDEPATETPTQEEPAAPVEDTPAQEPAPIIERAPEPVEEPSNKVTMTVESGRFAKRSEESGRIFVLMSYPIWGNHHITELLLSQLKNPVDAIFAPIQARLPMPVTVTRIDTTAGTVPEMETVDMVVNGEPAKVRRPRRNGATPEGSRLEEMRKVAETPHAFQHHDSDNMCAGCGLFEEDGVHALAHREHDFLEAADGSICGVCGGAYDDALHLVAMSPEAQALIDSAREPVEA